MVSGVRPKRGPLLACEDRNGDMAHSARDLRRDCYAAVDIGASSGRVVVGFVEDGRIHLEEVHRFDNRQVRRGGHDCWDIDLLYGELVRGLALCKEAGFAPKSVGIDTWGVDFVLLDADDNLVGDAVAYRDERTQGMFEVADAIMSPEELYRRTGIQRQPFNTIYQFLALQRENPEQLEAAETFLMIPDYLGFLLTGEKALEYTNASTTGLLNAETGAWDETVLARFNIPRRLFRNVTMAGACLGPVKPSIAEKIGYDTCVVLPATHDTGSAFLAVPACDLPAVFLSSGTWSLLGVENRSPLTTAAAYGENFTNEGGYHFRYRFLKNIMGLWMIQSVKKEWKEELSFAQICEQASKEEITSLVDCNDDCFLAPKSMIEAVQTFCRESNQQIPETIGEIAAVIYNSLAKCYGETIREIEEITGNTYDTIYVVGGGANAGYLNELTAKYTKKKVSAGPTEATAIGNITVQMLHDGVFTSLPEARTCIGKSFDIRHYDENGNENQEV